MKILKNCLLCFIFISLTGLTALMGQAPPPEDILGFEVGADYHLATYDQAIQYFRVLENNSDRIRLFNAGKTSMGQDMIYAVISQPETLEQLDKYKSISRRLSLAQGLSETSALDLAEQGKAIVYIDGGLHASECAPAQHNIQLAYNMVTGNDNWTRRILSETILILVFANPDGMNLLAEWYHPHVGTPYEVSPMPWLYHIFAGHDNNRDSYIANLVETQNITRLINQEWFPVILYNHHQTAPFPARIWTPPNAEPTNPNVHPLVVRWQNMVGSAMGEAFDAEDKEGAISRIIFDTWYPGYVTQVVDSHNIISILTETALYRYATPHFYTVRDFPEEYQDMTMSAFYPNPWKGGWWRIGDAVDYCMTASKAVLDVAARYREKMLFNKYKMAKDVISRFKNEPPYGWIIPKQQHDPGTAKLLLDRMQLLGIQVYKSQEDFIHDGIQYSQGTYIIPASQPFGLFAKNMFEKQQYPDLRKYPDLWQGIIRPVEFEGAPLSSYDQMGWTLPVQFGVQANASRSPLEMSMTQAEKVVFRINGITGQPDYAYVLSHQENKSFTAMNRILKGGGRVLWTKNAFYHNGQNFPAGTILVLSESIDRTAMDALAEELNLEITGIAGKPDVETMEIKTTRLGLYQSWVANADEGWTRFLMEQYEFPYTILHDAEIQAGQLHENYDSIIIPSFHRSEIILNGHQKGTVPPKYAGGISTEGVRSLQEFVENGGTLICLNNTCDFAIESLHLPVRNVLNDVQREDFICNGSLLRVEFNVDHPVAFGMTPEAPGMFSGSCAFDILPAYEDKKKPDSVAKYAKEHLLMSGWIHGEKIIHQKSAILDVAKDKGRVILLGFPVQFRAQPYGTFKLLLNSIFLGGR
jgi:hypothetical protein